MEIALDDPSAEEGTEKKIERKWEFKGDTPCALYSVVIDTEFRATLS